MSVSRIANRYATPLLELAGEQNQLDEVREDIRLFEGVLESNRDFLLMLQSPIISNRKKATILDEVFKGKVSELTAQFFQLVARKNRERFLPDIAREFVKLYNNKLGFQEAKLTTATAIDAPLKAAFEKLVSDITGKKPILREEVDPTMIGGYALKLGDRQLDETVLSQLNDLKLKFQKETI